MTGYSTAGPARRFTSLAVCAHSAGHAAGTADKAAATNPKALRYFIIDLLRLVISNAWPSDQAFIASRLLTFPTGTVHFQSHRARSARYPRFERPAGCLDTLGTRPNISLKPVATKNTK